MKIKYTLLTLLSASLVAAAPAPFVVTDTGVATGAENVAVPVTGLDRRQQVSVYGFRKRTLELRNALLAARGGQRQNQEGGDDVEDAQEQATEAGQDAKQAQKDAEKAAKDQQKADEAQKKAQQEINQAQQELDKAKQQQGQGAAAGNATQLVGSGAAANQTGAVAGNGTEAGNSQQGQGNGRGKGKDKGKGKGQNHGQAKNNATEGTLQAGGQEQQQAGGLDIGKTLSSLLGGGAGAGADGQGQGQTGAGGLSGLLGSLTG